jgi:hypothetical protein
VSLIENCGHIATSFVLKSKVDQVKNIYRMMLKLVFTHTHTHTVCGRLGARANCFDVGWMLKRAACRTERCELTSCVISSVDLVVFE